MTGAIRLAVDNELKRGARFSEDEIAQRSAVLDRLQAKIAAQAIDRSQTDEQILGYDENGLPN